MAYLHPENKEKVLSILRDKKYFTLLSHQLVTLEECISHGDNLFNFQRLHYFTPRGLIRHEMELFCKGLGKPEQFIKGCAIKELSFLFKKLLEEKAQYNNPPPYLIAKMFFGVVNYMLSEDLEKKSDAVMTLIEVLRNTPNRYLTQEQIESLTHTMGDKFENHSAMVIRTKVLEPLQIEDLSELNLEINSSLSLNEVCALNL
jgi:Glu-tRNA(Gln) amidotransferase subunit E-like FAD-binding protein